MKIRSRLYNTIIKILSQHKKWLDVRHMFTLAWMVVGVIRSEKISIPAWIPYVEICPKHPETLSPVGV